METKFKINTATARTAVKKLIAISKVKEIYSLSDDQWLEILFDTGCQLVEQNIEIPNIADSILMNPEYCFWDWYIAFFSDDDSQILSDLTINDSYFKHKYMMLDSVSTIIQFNHFLNSNRKINGF